jgi:BirA family biotin operon repressor/biotin-[acetyl-CoA-carboxylase] ligase
LCADAPPPAGWPEGVGLRRHASLDSTNAEAARLAAAGVRGPLWIIAARQSAGRGRQGRAWSSPEGNLHATCLLHPSGPPAQVALLSFAAALALVDALSASAAPAIGARLALKWPNDVLLDGAKIAGILLEGAGGQAGMGHLALGFGVNLAEAPGMAAPDALASISLAAATGHAPAPETVLAPLARALIHWHRRLQIEGFAPVRAAWLARAARLGQPVRARTARREVHGVFQTIDDAGALVLAPQTGGPVAISAAEVFF